MALSSNFHRDNRKRLLAENYQALFVLGAYTKMQRRADAAYPFEQEANFWYLCGVEEPDWWLILNGSTGEEWLVEPEHSEVRQVFEGVVGAESVKATSGIDRVITQDEAEELLSGLSTSMPVVYTVLPPKQTKHYGFYLNPAQAQLRKRLGVWFGEIKDCRDQVETLRAIKKPEEIALLQKAVDVTVKGIEAALMNLDNYRYEYEFEAELNRSFRLLGAQGHAYDPIIASGVNACTLHYQKNSKQLKRDEWLLFDVGARYGSYCADITRCVPLGRNATKRQLDVYRAVKNVHDIAISLCKPGQNVTQYQKTVMRKMGEELHRLELISDPLDDAQIHRYFPHAISHGLGIDVHDPLGRPKTFEPGMVLTVEPGIYIPEENFGVRLENDIHITSSGPVNLSEKLPSDIETLQELAA